MWLLSRRAQGADSIVNLLVCSTQEVKVVFLVSGGPDMTRLHTIGAGTGGSFQVQIFGASVGSKASFLTLDFG